MFDGLDVGPVGLLDRTKEGESDTDRDGVVTVILSTRSSSCFTAEDDAPRNLRLPQRTELEVALTVIDGITTIAAIIIMITAEAIEPKGVIFFIVISCD